MDRFEQVGFNSIKDSIRQMVAMRKCDFDNVIKGAHEGRYQITQLGRKYNDMVIISQNIGYLNFIVNGTKIMGDAMLLSSKFQADCEKEYLKLFDWDFLNYRA